MGRYNRDPREFRSQVSADGLRWSSDVATSGVTVHHADRPGGRIIHGPSGGGLGKQVSAETTGTGDPLREDEEATGSRSQEGRARYSEPHISGRQNPKDYTGVQ